MIGDDDSTLPDDMLPAAAGERARTAALRARAKRLFPGVLLTLASIIQALALETLWGEIAGQAEAVGVASLGAVVWLQGSALLLAIMVLWIFYAQLVMRLAWVPRLIDSLVPFGYGLGQFLLADTIGSLALHLWLLPFPFIFALALLAWNATLAHAAEEPENAQIIDGFLPASRLVRLGPMVGTIVVLLALALVVWLAPGTALACLLMLNLLMLGHLVLQGAYWRRSMGLH